MIHSFLRREWLHCPQFSESAGIVSGAGSMKRSSVRPFVRLSVPSTDGINGVRPVCCWVLRGQEMSIYSMRRHSAATVLRRRMALCSNKCGQCHVDRRRTRLSTDSLALKPDLQNILRQSYDYLTIMPKSRSTYDGRLINKTSYEGARLF